MINEEIATIFENMSRVLSFREASRYRARASRKGGDRFRIMAYQRAAVATNARRKHQSLCVIPSFYDPKAW